LKIQKLFGDGGSRSKHTQGIEVPFYTYGTACQINIFPGERGKLTMPQSGIDSELPEVSLLTMVVLHEQVKFYTG
ncbi:hypothetical protein, partial [Citrobacter gillenii]|uniref:hypothetical protein n=1 Tax=Citrobacter gillenii TaxID=67828 RepID=UPI0022E5A733